MKYSMEPPKESPEPLEKSGHRGEPILHRGIFTEDISHPFKMPHKQYLNEDGLANNDPKKLFKNVILDMQQNNEGHKDFDYTLPDPVNASSTVGTKLYEDTVFLNYVDNDFVEVSENQFFTSVDEEQKDKINTNEITSNKSMEVQAGDSNFQTKLAKFLTTPKSNDILFVNYYKPMPTRYSQNLDQIVQKLQESGAEILSEEELLESDAEGTGASNIIETEYYFICNTPIEQSTTKTAPNLSSTLAINTSKNKLVTKKKKKMVPNQTVQNVKNKSPRNTDKLVQNTKLKSPKSSGKQSIKGKENIKSTKTEDSPSSAKEQDFENVANNNYVLQENVSEKLVKSKRILKKNLQNKDRGKSNPIDVKMIQMVKRKLLSEKSKTLRNSKKIVSSPKSNKQKKKLSRKKKVVKAQTKDRFRLREKHLSQQELENVTLAFKRLKENKKTSYNNFLKATRNVVEIKPSDIYDPEKVAATQMYFLQKEQKEAKKRKSRIKNVEIVKDCRAPIKTHLKLVSSEIVNRSKIGLMRKQHNDSVIEENNQKKISNNSTIFKQKDVPSFTPKKNLIQANIKTYMNRKKHTDIEEPFQKNILNIDCLKIVENEFQKTTKTILNDKRSLNLKDVVNYKDQIVKCLEKQPPDPQKKIKLEILGVVELDPLYMDQSNDKTNIFSNEQTDRPVVTNGTQSKRKRGRPKKSDNAQNTKTEIVPQSAYTRSSQRISQTAAEEEEWAQELQSDYGSDRYSPLPDPDDDEAPFMSRDPTMLQNDDYDDDIMCTPLHNGYSEDITFSPNVRESHTEEISNNDELNRERVDSILRDFSVNQEEANNKSTALEDSSYCILDISHSTVQSVPENQNTTIDKSPKKSTLSAKIIRRAPIYQDAAKVEKVYDEEPYEPAVLMSREQVLLQEGQDPYEFDDEDADEDMKEDFDDMISGLQRVIHNPKKKTCERNGDRKAKMASVFPCDQCLYIGSNVHNLERHMLTHMDPQDIVWYQCDKCTYKTKYKYALKGHADVHKDAADEKIFACHLCNYKAHRKQNLNKHIYASHNIVKEEEVFQCYDCGKHFNAKGKLTIHINNVHASSCEKCQFCNFVTLNKITLASHIKTKHTDIERSFFCSQCPFKSKFPRDLDKHILRMHNRDKMKKFDCVKCDFSTIYKSNMRYHMTHVHNSKLDEKIPRQFICGHCMKVCNNKMGLKAHIWQRHMKLSEENYFKCTMCQYKSKVRNNLKRHMFLKHEQEGTKCKKCAFTTTRPTSMIAHMVAHKKEEKSKIYRDKSLCAKNAST